MLDDFTFQGIQHRLETSLIALDDSITPDQFTVLQITLDNLSGKLVEAVRKDEPTAGDIDDIILLAEAEYNESVGNQQEIVRQMAEGENIEPLAEMFDIVPNGGVKAGELNVSKAGCKRNPAPGADSINDKIRASMAKKTNGTV